jgi:hypothetical protein
MIMSYGYRIYGGMMPIYGVVYFLPFLRAEKEADI